MKILSKILIPLFIMAFASSCDWFDKSNPEPEPELINPADANALSRVLIMPSGTQTVQGNAPISSTTSASPQVSSQLNQTTSSNGSTVPLRFSYSNINGNLKGCYAQVDGANTYFNLPYSGQSGNSGDLSLPIGIPANVDQGTFCVDFSVYDTQGRVSDVASVCIEVLRLGTGALQVSLSWDTPTDQDLYVTDPQGNTIYYSNSYSSTGGELDRDDTDGFGPENIFWLQDAPDGEYVVEVNDYEYTSTPNTCYVTVNTPNKTKSFTVSTSNGQTKQVVRITKSGNNYNF